LIYINGQKCKLGVEAQSPNVLQKIDVDRFIVSLGKGSVASIEMRDCGSPTSVGRVPRREV
jgi:hypothetical protein